MRDFHRLGRVLVLSAALAACGGGKSGALDHVTLQSTNLFPHVGEVMHVGAATVNETLHDSSGNAYPVNGNTGNFALAKQRKRLLRRQGIDAPPRS